MYDETYRKLHLNTRSAVNAWLDRGEPLHSALGLARALEPDVAAVFPGDSFAARQYELDRWQSCEHEGAHFAVLAALGATEISARVYQDHSGHTNWDEDSTSRSAVAVALVAPEIWLAGFRHAEYPFVRGCSGDQKDLFIFLKGDLTELLAARQHALTFVSDHTVQAQIFAIADELYANGSAAQPGVEVCERENGLRFSER